MGDASRRCRGCGCTDGRPCPGGGFWVEADLCSACAPAAERTPVYQEWLGGSVIDAARISVLAAMHLVPRCEVPLILLPGDEDDDHPPADVHFCLHQAMQWLDAARAVSIDQAAGAPTSVHIITPADAGGGAG